MDYKEYETFVAELRTAGITEKKAIAKCMEESFEYLAEDEVEAILGELL